MLEHLLDLPDERGALVRIERGRRNPGALLGLALGLFFLGAAACIGGCDALDLVLAPLLGLEVGLTLRGRRRLRRCLLPPLRIEVGLAPGGSRRLVLPTPLGVEIGLAPRGVCRRLAARLGVRSLALDLASATPDPAGCQRMYSNPP